MEFKKYQHVGKIGQTETKGIEFGTCHIFPKIDGTNASVWLDNGVVQCGSRNRQLTIESDNAGFAEWISRQGYIKALLLENPQLRLFGEWLVPHSLKTYEQDAWRKFYVFDVLHHVTDENYSYLPYEEYKVLCDKFGLDYIPPIATIENPTHDTLVAFLERNSFLIGDGNGIGEGVVVKNYDYRNTRGRRVWGKIVTNSFKAKHNKEMGAPVIQQSVEVEGRIVSGFVTTHLVEKVYAKMILNEEWSSKMIPRLLNTVFYDLVSEESWAFVKKFKNPTIDFRRLSSLTFQKVKKCKPELF